jgi:hypothetical protein
VSISHREYSSRVICLLQKAGRENVAAFIYFNISDLQLSTPDARGWLYQRHLCGGVVR